MTGKIDGIYVELKANVDAAGVVTGEQKITDSAKKIQNEFQKVDSALIRTGKVSATAFGAFDKSLSSSQSELKNFITQQVALGRSINDNGDVITAHGVKASKLTEEFKSLSQEYENNKRISNKSAAAMSVINDKIKKIDISADGAQSELALFAAELDKLEKESRQAAAVLNEASNASKKLDAAAAAAAKSSAVATKKMGNFGRSAGMAGIQFQQFTGQVQGGVNPMIALSQQAADLGIVMGAPLLGVVASLGAGLALFLVPELFNAKKATSELTDKLKELKNEQVLTAEQTKFLALSQAAETREKQKKIAETEKEIESLTKLLALQEAQADSAGGGRSAAANRKNANKRIEETNFLLAKNKAALSTLNQETGKLEVVSTDVEKSRQEGIKKTTDISTALQQQIALANAEIDGGENAARRLAIALELGYNNAALLPQTMRDSLTELERVEAKQVQINETEREEAQKTAKLKSELRAQEAKEKTARGSNLERMQAEILGEEELLKLKYARQFVLLEESLIKDGLAEDTYSNLKKAKAEQLNADLVAIEKRKTDAMNMLAESERQSKISAVSGTMSALASLMNTGSRKLFKIGKAAAMGNAIVDGYSAVSKTMASVPYPFNIPLAAAQAIASAAQVQGIAKQKFGGAGGGVNTFSGGVPAVNTTQAAPQQTQNVDVRVTASGGGIVDMFNFEVANGANPIMGG